MIVKNAAEHEAPAEPAWRLALAQMRVDPGNVASNLTRAEDRVRAARALGADVVLLPEALDCGWTHPSARELAGGIPGGAAGECLRAVAREQAVTVCAGLIERAGDRLYNAAVLFGPDGTLLLHHRKIHELDFARELYARGDRLGVAETPFGRLGVMICADGFAPDQAISRALGEMGAGVILSPCAWAVPPDHDNVRTPYGQLWLDNYGPVARHFGLTIAGCSCVGSVTAGEWAGWRCIGCSMVIGPEGIPLIRGPYGAEAEALLIVKVPYLPVPKAGTGVRTTARTGRPA